SRFKEDGSKIIPVYIAILREKDADSGLKQVVVDGLGEFGKEAVSGTDELVAVLEDISAPLLLRRSAAVSLVEVEADCKKVWPTVKKIMKSQANELRSQAARLAGKTCKNEPEAVDALIELCKDRNQDVQIAAIQELGEFGPAARKA